MKVEPSMVWKLEVGCELYNCLLHDPCVFGYGDFINTKHHQFFLFVFLIPSLDQKIL
jgi:hypothetical protein